MGTTKVKGKSQPVELYRVLDVGRTETRLGAAVARGLTPFVGRHTELRILATVFDDVEARQGQIASIIGEAGVGKSRLLLEFRRSLQDREFSFLLGECLPFGTSIAYLPLRGLFRSYFGLKEGAEPLEVEHSVRSTLSRLDLDASFFLTPLFDVLSIPWKDAQYETMEPRQKKERIFASLSKLLTEESRARPLVVAIESAMWIDRTSEEFLSYFAQSLSGARILLILLYRPGYSRTWGEKTSFTRIEMDQLPATDAPQLITSLLDAPPSRELQDLLTVASGGNPLFIEELINSLFEKGCIAKTAEGYALNIPSTDLPIPATIHGIIAARIDHLAEPLKRVLQFASVIGKHFSLAVLLHVYEQDQNLALLLEELQQLDLIYEANRLPHLGTQVVDRYTTEGAPRAPSLAYRFKHDLVQEVAYNSLLVRKRKEIHQAVGEAIEIVYSDNIDQVQEILAYHFSKSNDSQKAYIYLKQSGAKNTRNSSLWEAFRFYKQALSLNFEISQTEGLETRLQMASAMISLGFPEDSLEILKQAEAIARNVDNKKSLTSIISMIGLYYSVRGDTLRGIRYALACLATAEETGDVDLIAPIVFDLCSNYVARGEYSHVIQIAPMALSLLKETGKQDESFSRGYNIYSAILAFYAFSFGFLGRFEHAAALFEEGLHLATNLENLYSMGLNEILRGYVFCQKADGRTALTHFERSIGYLERGQIFVLLGLAWNGVGRARYFLGDLQDALTYAEKGLKIHRDAGVTYNLSAHHWFLALVHYELGNLTAAGRELEESYRLARRNRESYYIALSKMLRGKVDLEAGAVAPREAERAIGLATRTLAAQGVRPQVGIARLSLAEISFSVGNRRKMSANLHKALALFQEMGMVYWEEKARKLAALARL
ncbi:MAG TPA: hypothetical protein DCR97_11520 [Deltaproteobacteria bacterium]|nr:hypothetical protein [Deltaproteobacteria bacterium]